MAKRRESDNLKNKIIETTENLLCTKTFSEISLKEISLSAGVSPGTLYYYYKSKDDLAVDVYFEYMDRLIGETIAWINDERKDTSFHRILKFTIEKGTRESALRINLIALSQTNENIREKVINRYNDFYEAFYQKLKAILPINQAIFLAWLLPIISDGVNVQQCLRNPEFRKDEFTTLAEDFFENIEQKASPLIKTNEVNK